MFIVPIFQLLIGQGIRLQVRFRNRVRNCQKIDGRIRNRRYPERRISGLGFGGQVGSGSLPLLMSVSVSALGLRLESGLASDYIQIVRFKIRQALHLIRGSCERLLINAGYDALHQQALLNYAENFRD